MFLHLLHQAIVNSMVLYLQQYQWEQTSSITLIPCACFIYIKNCAHVLRHALVI
ncbi:hypothetical protein DsansV1_C35g0229721 [Dioscorea sansibarensis]